MNRAGRWTARNLQRRAVVLNLIALTISVAAAYLPHLLLGDRLSFFTDFMLGAIVGGVGYVVAIYQLKKMRGDF